MRTSFDRRVVDYEYLHGITNEHKRLFIEAINPKKGEKILDAFCGYGYAGKLCLEQEKQIHLWLNDESKSQLKKAEENLLDIPKERFVCSNFLNSGFKTDFFDKIIIKQGIHELPKNKQIGIFKEASRILKKDGKLVIWEFILTKKNQKMYQEIIREKDKMAGFLSMAENRYFLREDELLKNAKKAGFKTIKEAGIIEHPFHSKRFAEQDFRDSKMLVKFNNFIKKVFIDKLKNESKYDDKTDNIHFINIDKVFILSK